VFQFQPATTFYLLQRTGGTPVPLPQGLLLQSDFRTVSRCAPRRRILLFSLFIPGDIS
jgi:hypothetical protein